MSEITAVGPARSLDGPVPVPPEHSLLETELLDENGNHVGVVVDRNATTILNGVNVWSYPTGGPDLWEPCSDGTWRTKSDESEQLTSRFDSFVVIQRITCSAIGMGDAAMEEWRQMVRAVLEATDSQGVEKALAEGVSQSTNPFFGDVNVDVLAAGAAQSPGVALSYLEEAIGTTGRRGMIHATPAVVAALQAFPLGNDMDRLVTANGTPVVSGHGYQDVDTPWLATPGATEDWVFATGPVEVHLGPIILDTVKESLDRSDNSITLRAERYVLALWDTALQSAVLVDWAT